MKGNAPVVSIILPTKNSIRFLRERVESIRAQTFADYEVIVVDTASTDGTLELLGEWAAADARVLRCLTDGPKTVSEIAGLLEMGKNGHISAALDQLAEAGFVTADQGRNPETGVDMRERRYRLRDNYTRFYLKYVEPVKTVIDSDSYSFVSLEQLEGWDAVMGLAFENLVLNHFHEFLPRLGLGKALVVLAAPYRKFGSEKRHVRGCQVDLLVQTENTICLVEVKRRKSIDGGVIDEMDDKVEALSRPKGKTIRTALVYDGELAKTVEASGYFNAIVNIREILL